MNRTLAAFEQELADLVPTKAWPSTPLDIDALFADREALSGCEELSSLPFVGSPFASVLQSLRIHKSRATSALSTPF
jgi:hypothetical protein